MRYKLSPFPIVTYAASPPKKTAPFSKTSGCQLPATFKRTRFPAAAHLVCDEDQQLTAEALEAARIAVNKCPTRPTSRDEWEGTKREVTGGWCLVDVIDGEGYLLITNQLLLICNKLETPTTSHRWLKKKVHLRVGVSPKTRRSQMEMADGSHQCFFLLVASPQGLSQFHWDDDWKGWSSSMMVDFSAEISLFEDNFAKTSILFQYCWFCVHH